MQTQCHGRPQLHDTLNSYLKDLLLQAVKTLGALLRRYSFCHIEITNFQWPKCYISLYPVFFLNFIYWFGRERETSICRSTYLCLRWLLVCCALTRDQTHNLSVLGWCSNQLSYPARALFTWFSFSYLKFVKFLKIVVKSIWHKIYHLHYFSV